MLHTSITSEGITYFDSSGKLLSLTPQKDTFLLQGSTDGNVTLSGLGNPVNDSDAVNNATLVSTTVSLRDELVLAVDTARADLITNISDVKTDLTINTDLLRTDTQRWISEIAIGHIDPDSNFSFTNIQDITINGTLSGQVASFEGAVDAASFISKSDLRLKSNLAPIEHALEKIGQIRGYDFDWADGSGPSIGVIAQEIQKIIPCAVSERNEYLHVDYSNIIPLLIECVRELSAKVELLSNKT
jgi:hypothetical protein